MRTLADTGQLHSMRAHPVRAPRDDRWYGREPKPLSTRTLDMPRQIPDLSRLTPRERQVLHWIGQGLTNREIGDCLGIAEKTVKNTVSSVLAKMGMQRRTQAAAHIAVLEATAPEVPTSRSA